MTSPASKPLIVQSDRTIFLEVDHPDFAEVRDRLMVFAELEKSPEHIHVYRLTAISLWNAAASGMSSEDVLAFFAEYSKFPIPANIRREIEESIDGYGKLRLIRDVESDELHLLSDEPGLIDDLWKLKHLQEFLEEERLESALRVKPHCRGQLKLALIKVGHPVDDLAGYRDGEALEVELSGSLEDGTPFGLREYQSAAVDAFHAGGSTRGGSGVVVLPCGAGKTIVGIGALAAVGRQTLILTTNITALRQWKREILEKTKLPEEMVGEYSGEIKEIRPVTLSTYQILTYRKSQVDEFSHFSLFSENSWGLIIYDEVHLLPAPVFRFTAEIQATRRLGLTATLVREDGREAEVFSLIGPRKYDVPWRSLETGGWIANAECIELRVDLDTSLREPYLTADQRGKFRISSENPRKTDLVKRLIQKHSRDHVLILGQYLDQLREIGEALDAPIITGKTRQQTRDELYASFRSGEIPVLIVSKVGNFAVDLPDANIAIQISGTFGSRQEEAQRLGRILRPKKDSAKAMFYSVVTRDSREQEFAEKRQLFLTEQGYSYAIRDASEFGAESPDSGSFSQAQCS